MMPLRDDQYISLSPTDSPAEDAEMDTVDGQQVGKGLTELPGDTPRTPGPTGVNFQQFCDQLQTDLPGDSRGRRSFDTRTRFVAGDPGARFGSAAPLEYEVTGEIGRPHWELIFEHVLRQCGYLRDFHTVYVMVDNRDLANHQRQDPSLPHWPAAARWWHSRLKLMGPHKEKTELLLFPISESTGLHHVHPTWAGTFVLAALVAVFPGINFVLLDSDCLPVTLFEVEDLWTEAYLARFPAHCESGIPQAHPLRALARYSKDPQVVYTQSRVSSTRMGQAALVVSEPHAELNAGLIVIFRSPITSLLQKVLTHPAGGLVDDTNAALLTQKFWVQAIYTELLCASSRHKAVREHEKQRPPTGLVKVVCLPFDGAAAQKHGRRNPTDARFETMLGGSSWVDSLFVWFPASWMPLVVEAIREKSFAHHQASSQMNASTSTDQTQVVLPEGLDFTFKVKRWQADAKGCCPVLQSCINVNWLTFDPRMFVPLYPRLREGILCDVFIQKAVAAWDSAPGNRIMVSLLLPGPMANGSVVKRGENVHQYVAAAKDRAGCNQSNGD